MKDLHLEAGLVSTKNEEGEVEYIGTRKEWQKFEDLEKKELSNCCGASLIGGVQCEKCGANGLEEPADEDEVREGEKVDEDDEDFDDARESVLREEAKIAYTL